MIKLESIKECIIKAHKIVPEAKRVEEVTARVNAALEEGRTPQTILDEELVAGMDVVGDLFKKNEYYIPEVLLSAQAMKVAMQILKPKLVEDGVKPRGKFLIGTVQGDLHDLGKDLVAMMLEGGGFEVFDLGVDVSPEKFIEEVKNKDVQLVGMSALLTTTMPSMKKTLKALKDAGVSVKTMIGGAPITQGYADKIGADGYAADAATAVDVAKGLVVEVKSDTS